MNNREITTISMEIGMSTILASLNVTRKLSAYTHIMHAYICVHNAFFYPNNLVWTLSKPKECIFLDHQASIIQYMSLESYKLYKKYVKNIPYKNYGVAYIYKTVYSQVHVIKILTFCLSSLCPNQCHRVLFVFMERHKGVLHINTGRAQTFVWQGRLSPRTRVIKGYLMFLDITRKVYDKMLICGKLGWKTKCKLISPAPN